MQYKFKLYHGNNGSGWLYTHIFDHEKRVEIYEYFVLNFFNGKRHLTISEPEFYGLFKGNKKLKVNEKKDGDFIRKAFECFNEIPFEEKERYILGRNKKIIKGVA